MGLISLAFNNADNQLKIKIADNGGIEAVVAAMEAHKTRVLVQQHACLLRNLATQGSPRQRIKTAGGVECVKRAVNASITPADTKRWPSELLDKLK